MAATHKGPRGGTHKGRKASCTDCSPVTTTGHVCKWCNTQLYTKPGSKKATCRYCGSDYVKHGSKWIDKDHLENVRAGLTDPWSAKKTKRRA